MMMMMSFLSSPSSLLQQQKLMLKNRLQLQLPPSRKKHQHRYYLFSIIVFILVFMAVINYIELSSSSSSITKIDYLRYLRNNTTTTTSKSITTTTSKQQQQQQQKRTSTKTSIAICITGMPERLQPWHVFKHLISPNIPDFDFHIIFALSEHTQLKYSSRPDATFESSPYAKYTTPEQLKLALFDEGKKYNNIDFENENETTPSNGNPKLDVLPFITDLSKQQWLDYFQVSKLDRITQYADDSDGTQINILNMYNHQVICGKHIESIEESSQSSKFDYIINTREDAHYFKDINLNRLVTYTTTTTMIMTTQTQTQDNDNDNDNDNESSSCDLITKNCLDFGGINMRFQFMNGRLGIKLLTQRLDFYQRMYDHHNVDDDNDDDDDDDNDDESKKATKKNNNNNNIPIPSYITNPERFELHQLMDAKANVCKLPISIIPVNVGRHTQNGDICFLPYEVDQCVPLDKVKYVNKKKCYNFDWKPK